jgi:hypothetical protein
MHRKVHSGVSLSFSWKLLFSSVHDNSTFGYLSHGSLSVYQINRQAWVKLHVSVAITNHISSPKLFNCCHARRWELIIAGCIFISFQEVADKLQLYICKGRKWEYWPGAIFIWLSLSCFLLPLFAVENLKPLDRYLLQYQHGKGLVDLIWSNEVTILRREQARLREKEACIYEYLPTGLSLCTLLWWALSICPAMALNAVYPWLHSSLAKCTLNLARSSAFRSNGIEDIWMLVGFIPN